jgi:hypothetical protein
MVGRMPAPSQVLQLLSVAFSGSAAVFWPIGTWSGFSGWAVAPAAILVKIAKVTDFAKNQALSR